MSKWNPANYDRAWKALADAGKDPHGEVAFVERALTRHLGSHGPRTGGEPILDAGCGTGRVAIELATRGYDVGGTDVDESMLAHAKSKSPDLKWHLGSLAAIAIPGTFATIVMAGNVILFVDELDRQHVVTNVARHLNFGGYLIAGFQLQRDDGRRVSLSDWDTWTSAAGLALVERFATWDEDPFTPTDDYAVSVHRRG